MASSYQVSASMNPSLAFVSCLSASTRAKTPQQSLQRNGSIFSPEAIGCSSTPNKNNAPDEGERNAVVNSVASGELVKELNESRRHMACTLSQSVVYKHSRFYSLV